MILFLSTLSLRRATTTANEALQKVKISIHALLAESDPVGYRKPVQRRDFYPRSPCGERRGRLVYQLFVIGISIHALLAESDLQSTHSCDLSMRFLSTLSLRRATTGNIGWVGTARHFYPRSPCGERHHYGWSWYDDFTISIHALLAESDTSLVVIGTNCVISIHALLAESDLSIHLQALAGHHFYPRSPCGERLLVTSCMPVSGDFYPRSPCGERHFSLSIV